MKPQLVNLRWFGACLITWALLVTAAWRCSPPAAETAGQAVQVTDYATQLAVCRALARAHDGGFAEYEVCAEGVDKKFGVQPSGVKP